jgi:hypothetical protein
LRGRPSRCSFRSPRFVEHDYTPVAELSKTCSPNVVYWPDKCPAPGYASIGLSLIYPRMLVCRRGNERNECRCHVTWSTDVADILRSARPCSGGSTQVWSSERRGGSGWIEGSAQYQHSARRSVQVPWPGHRTTALTPGAGRWSWPTMQGVYIDGGGVVSSYGEDASPTGIGGNPALPPRRERSTKRGVWVPVRLCDTLLSIYPLSPTARRDLLRWREAICGTLLSQPVCRQCSQAEDCLQV